MSIEDNVIRFSLRRSAAAMSRFARNHCRRYQWIIPRRLAGTHRGHAGLADVLQKANETVETSYPKPPEFMRRETGSGRRLRDGKNKATNKRSRTIGFSTLPFKTAK